MPIRVIAGSAKGRTLKLVPGNTTRPVMDRVKEALFSILGGYVDAYRFLDLFAGTGSVGIEALSRGAAHVTFVERDAAALKTIAENLAITGLEAGAEIVRADVFRHLKQPPAEGYDCIYVAPPQYLGLWEKTIIALDKAPAFFYPDGIAIAQIDPKEYRELSLSHLELYDQRTYGKTMLCFYERPGT